MAAEMDVLCNAGYGEVTPERANRRNGYRPRQLDTRVGSIDVSIPKLREGSYFRAGYWSPAGGPSGPWWRWLPSATCVGCRPAGWKA
jgi:Transposase, Mutator family